MTNTRSLFLLNYNAFGLKVEGSNIAYDGVGCSVFFGRPFGQRDCGILLRNNSLLKRNNAVEGLEKVWWWRHVCHCKRVLHLVAEGSKDDFELHGNETSTI